MELNKNQTRMRFQPTGMRVREQQDGEEKRVIEGCAIVFNQETTLFDGKYYREREIIMPSCVTDEFLRDQDIKLNLLHDRDSSLARNNRGHGTLQLDLREDGLYFSFEVPDCDLGKRALALIENGTYTGCSFEFYPKDYNIDTTTLEDGREDDLVTHTEFERITALTIAMDPAYEQTSVGEREQKREAEAKKNAEEREQQLRAEQEDERKAKDKENRDRQIKYMQMRMSILEIEVED